LALQEIDRFTLKKKPHWFNWGLVMFIAGAFFLLFAIEDLTGVGASEVGITKSWIILGICIPVVVVAHEALHGIFFKAFGGKVQFGFKRTKIGPVAYTKSPDPFTKYQFLAAALAPQILTIAALIALPLVSSPVIAYALMISAIGNLGGGCMDIFMVAWLKKFPKDVIIKDAGDGIGVFKEEA